MAIKTRVTGAENANMRSNAGDVCDRLACRELAHDRYSNTAMKQSDA